MRPFSQLLPVLFFSILFSTVVGQTNKDIQGTWRGISTTITSGDNVFKMDSSTHNLTKTITGNRVIFTVYDTKADTLVGTGQGRASTKGNQYIETFEQSTIKDLLKEPPVFTYKIQGNKLSYEGGTKEFHIVEVLKRIE